MDVFKIDVVKLFLILKCIKDVWFFFGLCNYYWKFIYDYSIIIGLLIVLLRKDNKFKWCDEC